MIFFAFLSHSFDFGSSRNDLFFSTKIKFQLLNYLFIVFDIIKYINHNKNQEFEKMA